jgi:hypothetical protein
MKTINLTQDEIEVACFSFYRMRGQLDDLDPAKEEKLEIIAKLIEKFEAL